MKQKIIIIAVFSLILFGCGKSETSTTASTNDNEAKIVVSSAPTSSTPTSEQVKITLAISTKSSGFTDAKPNQILDIPVTIVNNGDTPYTDPTNISYHLFDVNGKEILHDGERTALELPIAPGKDKEQDVRVYAPKEAGAYVVQVDLVKEGQYWFADKGMAQVRLPVEVKVQN